MNKKIPLDIANLPIYKSFKKSPYNSTKHLSYFHTYSELLNKYRDKKITFVEVGILDGGSLFMWRDFFGKKARIIGVEFNPAAKKWEKEGFEIYIGSQSDKNFWKEYGAVLKEGLYEDAERKETLLDLCRFSTNENDEIMSLSSYLEKMPENQKDIYYISAETRSQALASPHLEGFKSKNIPVLIMTDAIDQFWLPMIGSFKDKKFTSITQGQINLDDLDEKNKDKKSENKDQKEKQDKEFVDLIAQMKVVLGEQVKDIRLSSKLTDSPVCLVADDGDMDIAMEQLMAQRDTNYKGAPRILEINGDHSLIKNMKSLLSKKENNDLVSDAGTLLFEQARLLEGKMPADPAQFSKIMNQFLIKAIPE